MVSFFLGTASDEDTLWSPETASVEAEGKSYKPSEKFMEAKRISF